MWLDNWFVEKLFHSFSINLANFTCSLYGKGNINYTFLVTDGNWQKYILQKINTIFNVSAVMKNISSVSEHLLNKQKDWEWWKEYKILYAYTWKDGLNYSNLDWESWRVYDFIEWSVVQDNVYYYHQAEEVGELLGQFHLSLSDMEEELYNPLPWFHYTPWYFKEFLSARSNTLLSDDERDFIIEDWIIKQEVNVKYFFNLIDTEQLPNRVTHNDPKVNNILFDKQTWKPLMLIDWDTISKDLPVLIDIWDMCRAICMNSLEEGDDYELVKFQEDIFDSLMKWYLKKWSLYLNDCEKKHIVFSVWFITFELAMRFYSDYLMWNIYFRARHKKQNYEKAKKMFSLWKDFELKKDTLEWIVKKYL